MTKHDMEALTVGGAEVSRRLTHRQQYGSEG